jgi:hypothetical protein
MRRDAAVFQTLRRHCPLSGANVRPRRAIALLSVIQGLPATVPRLRRFGFSQRLTWHLYFLKFLS